jgi:uncharacterized protein DUF4440
LKRCPTCNKTFTDQNLSFCIDDGTPLVLADASVDDEATQVSSSARKAESHSVDSASAGRESVPLYSPPGSYVPPGNSSDIPPGQHKRRAWPWIVSILAIVLLVFAGLGIAGVLLLPRMRSALSTEHNSNRNANVERAPGNYGSPRNSNTSAPADNENGNDNSDAQDTTPPPTDEAEVLADLTDLEHEWTVANINADKKKLNRILADDYVGTTEGRVQGKAEYLKTIERDTSIQKWDFEDLKVSLKGDRATLTGIIRLIVQNQNVAYRFTDKFVWRDNRWQATSSEVSPVT